MGTFRCRIARPIAEPRLGAEFGHRSAATHPTRTLFVMLGDTDDARGPVAMRFGVFGGAEAPRSGGDPGRGFFDYVETSVVAERLGFYSTFLVEHHFSGVGQVSSPLDLLNWVAARTSSIRLGTAVLVLAWHDPVLLAERAATLDLLSGERLDFGVGKGYRHSEFAGFCVPSDEADERFHESLSVILKAWHSDLPFSHEGRFWRYKDIVVEPATAQTPHIPLCGSPQEHQSRSAMSPG